MALQFTVKKRNFMHTNLLRNNRDKGQLSMPCNQHCFHLPSCYQRVVERKPFEVVAADMADPHTEVDHHNRPGKPAAAAAG